MALMYHLLNLIFDWIIIAVLCSFRAVLYCIELICYFIFVKSLTFVINSLSSRLNFILWTLFIIVICEVVFIYYICLINFVFLSFDLIIEFYYIIVLSFSDLLMTNLKCKFFIKEYFNLIDDLVIIFFDFIYFVLSRLYGIRDQLLSNLNVYFWIIDPRLDDKLSVIWINVIPFMSFYLLNLIFHLKDKLINFAS